MEVRRGAKDDELGVVPKYLYNDEIIIIQPQQLKIASMETIPLSHECLPLLGVFCD